MALVGRSAELVEVDHLLDQAEHGSGGLLAVVGGPGSGKTVLLAEVARRARSRGFDVLAGAPISGQPGLGVWAQVMRDAGLAKEQIEAFLGHAQPYEAASAIGSLVAGHPRLIAIDDLDLAGDDGLDVLPVVAARLVANATAVVVTASAPLGIGQEHILHGLGVDELAAVVGPIGPDQLDAVLVASRGMPGSARKLAGQLRELPPGQDPLVYLALHAVPRTEFLQVDDDLVRLLERALDRVTDDDSRARLHARLARELLGDPFAADRRRELMDEALRQARNGGDGHTVAELLDARLHALWDAAGATDRLATAPEIVMLARDTGDGRLERRGMLWRFVALMELGRVDEAERALVDFQRAAATAGDAEDGVIALSRQSMLAALRGRFETALTLADEVEEQGRRTGLPDLERLLAALRGAVVREQGDLKAAEDAVRAIYRLARRLPGHSYEATAAHILSQLGRLDEAAAELHRLLPQAIAAGGPRWLGVMTDLAVVAVDTHDKSASAQIYAALLPYQGRLAIWGGANAVNGPVSHYLGLLAGELDQPDQAVTFFQDAVQLEERIGALPALARTLMCLSQTLLASDRTDRHATDMRGRAVALSERLEMRVLLRGLANRPDAWTLLQDGDGWLLEAGQEQARLPDVQGLRHLRTLLAAPGRDVSALDLVAGGRGLAAPLPTPVVDEQAIAAYRRRIAELEAELDAADATGDAEKAERAEQERAAMVAEVRRATGLGGRVRRTSAEAERARVNVTRTLRSALTRIAEQAPRAGAHLDASIRTGLACRYDPNPDGPSGWIV